MTDSWSVLLVKDKPGLIQDRVKNALKMTACIMYAKNHERFPLKFYFCEGYMTTEGKTYVVGGTSGVLFKAQISSEDGEWKVNFLLSEANLKEGASRLPPEEESLSGGHWVSTEGALPVADLYKFADLRPSALN